MTGETLDRIGETNIDSISPIQILRIIIKLIFIGNEPKKLEKELEKNGLLIQYINLKDFEKRIQLNFMLKAVEQNGLSIQYIIPYLENSDNSIFNKDEILEIYLTAIKENGLAFGYILKNLNNSIYKFNDDEKLKILIAALNESSNFSQLKKINIENPKKIENILDDYLENLTIIDQDTEANKSDIEIKKKNLKLINYLDEDYQKNFLERIGGKLLEYITGKKIDTVNLFKKVYIKEYGDLDDVEPRENIIIIKKEAKINPRDLVKNLGKRVQVKFKKGEKIDTNTINDEINTILEISNGIGKKYIEVKVKVVNKSDFILENIKEKEDIKVKIGNNLNPKNLLKNLPKGATVSFEDNENLKNILNTEGEHYITVKIEYKRKEIKKRIKIQVCKEIESENIPNIKENKTKKIKRAKEELSTVFKSINNKTLNLERTFWTILKTIQKEELSDQKKENNRK